MSSPHRPRPSTILLGLLLAAGCNGRTPSPGPALPDSLVNLGLVSQASELAADGDLLLVAAREFQGGGRDLDQDGDAFDLVVFVLDLARGTTLNTGLALDVSAPAFLARVRGDLALFAVSERSSGARDLNGDSDADDAVAFVYDRRDSTTRNLGLALARAGGIEPAIGGDQVTFAVSEVDQGRDLDGDGSLGHSVLFVYDAATRTLTNTALDAPSRLFVEDGSLAWFADESAGDRNGDGDAQDRFVLQVLDTRTGASFDSGLATDGAPPIFAAGTWLVAVPEALQGVDLDGDGLLSSAVLHAIDVAAGSARSLGLDCVDSPCALALRPPGIRAQFALRVSEADGIDRNGDGDTLDRVLALYDPAADRLRSTGLACLLPPVLSGRTLGFLVDEGEQLRDLDGDGLLSHAVAFVADVATAVTTNLGQAAIDVLAGDDALILARRESEAESDWNDDGDLLDVVAHVYSPGTGLTVNTRVASVAAFGAGAGQVLLYADEAGEGRDLDGDGDRADQVFVLFDVASARAATTGLAGGRDAGLFGRLDARGNFAFLANELAQGRDLNGDGDLADDVLHRGR